MLWELVFSVTHRHTILTLLFAYLLESATEFYIVRNCKMDPNFADKIRHIRDPKARMAVVWNHCKTKTGCDPDEPPKDDGAEGENEEPKKGHGGCGHLQPQIRKEGLKLFVHYKKTKDDDEVCICRTRQVIHLD